MNNPISAPGSNIEIRREPLTGAYVWTGATTTGSDEWIARFSDGEIVELDQALRLVQKKGLKWRDVTRADFPLPRFDQRVAAIQGELEDGRGFLVLRGFPAERYTVEENEIIFWGLGTHLGAGVSQNAQGEYLSHVKSQGKAFGDKTVRGYQTSAELFFHNDHGDMVGLMCLHPARSGGVSKLVSTAAIYNAILASHPGYIDELCRGYIYHMRGEHQPGRSEVTEHRVPVFSYHAGKMSSRIARNAVIHGQTHIGQPLDQRGLAPLDLFDKLTEELCMQMNLQRGDMQWVSNHSVLHARSNFVDYDEPEKKRDLLRLWLNMPNGRPLTYEFATRYGPGSARLGIPPTEVAAG